MGPAFSEVAEIVADVSRRHRVPPADIYGMRKFRQMVHARQEVMALAHAAGLSTTQIGRALGGRDHTTVMWGIRAHARRAAQ